MDQLPTEHSCLGWCPSVTTCSVKYRCRCYLTTVSHALTVKICHRAHATQRSQKPYLFLKTYASREKPYNKKAFRRPCQRLHQVPKHSHAPKLCKYISWHRRRNVVLGSKTYTLGTSSPLTIKYAHHTAVKTRGGLDCGVVCPFHGLRQNTEGNTLYHHDVSSSNYMSNPWAYFRNAPH